MSYDLDKHYDLRAAIEYNSVPVPEEFEIIAEVLSEAHDEGEYFWLIKDKKTNLFYIINGSHDYTGWDCQSGASITEGFDDLNKLHLFLQEFDNQMRPVRQMIFDQAKGK